jgi:hypothetical protein
MRQSSPHQSRKQSELRNALFVFAFKMDKTKQLINERQTEVQLMSPLDATDAAL